MTLNWHFFFQTPCLSCSPPSASLDVISQSHSTQTLSVSLIWINNEGRRTWKTVYLLYCILAFIRGVSLKLKCATHTLHYSALSYYRIATNFMTCVSFLMYVCICIPFVSNVFRLFDVLIQSLHYEISGHFFKITWILLLLRLRLT
jgi:hypothetical protein